MKLTRQLHVYQFMEIRGYSNNKGEREGGNVVVRAPTKSHAIGETLRSAFASQGNLMPQEFQQLLDQLR